MKNYLWRCILIFILAFVGMTCLTVVDSISGTMVGYEPMLGITVNEIGDKSLEATAFGQKVYFDFSAFSQK
ncbi:hypothetical protein [Clostridium aminobutyricum]|uniref:Uncharacterized protein n=1 Tax=Clostridium aminobutyricum TaxID=33953 RepID=A0A939D6Z8_CLOAM|nr:hypothetical protein [Clostridium aminobutyricum]MBN7772252.1 hypothetical protein [Clostridium aminobutyricum]